MRLILSGESKLLLHRVQGRRLEQYELKAFLSTTMPFIRRWRSCTVEASSNGGGWECLLRSSDVWISIK